MRKYHVRFGGGRIEKDHQRDSRRWNLVSRLPYVIVFNGAGLHHIMSRYIEYYERSRTHLSLEKDADSTSHRNAD